MGRDGSGAEAFALVCKEPVDAADGLGQVVGIGQEHHPEMVRLDPKIYPIADDQQFAYELLAEEKVLIVQGTGFNWIAPDHFRMVFLPNSDDLTEAIGRIDRFLAHQLKRFGT